MIAIRFSMLLLTALISTALLSSSTTLKDLAAPNTLIGSVGIYQTFFPPQGKSQQNYRNLYQRELSAATVLCYPRGIWKSYRQYDFARFNTTVNWFESQGMTQMAHLLVGPNHYYPKWFIDNSYTTQQLEFLMEDYIRAVMQSNDNGKKIDIWNVVNEAVWVEAKAQKYYTWNIWNQLGWEEDRSGLKGADKKRDTHPVYIRKALEIARKYTDNKLELRDNGMEFPNDHEYRVFYQLVKHLLNQGVPLDAVGFQAHLSTNQTYDWEGLKNNIKRYKKLGLEVYITELDVANDGTREGREQQRQYYYDAVKAAREGGVDIINFWGLNDGQMGERKEDEFGLIFESPRMTPKPAYYGVRQALKDSK